MPKWGKAAKPSASRMGWNYTVTYNPVADPPVLTRSNLNRLKLEHPDIYEQYVTVSVHRRFTVKSDAEAA